ncbi:lysophospholipid acyltransferase family protein [Dokdonia sp. Hel_I_53]|uniref:lysophospholipid acyltransferase family protein n=1 Tax=Dokdonia sp. Hel_I_53 TaxID=1566287 RepID=UPI00119B2AC4|nr:lysophospholipid acyltransferase family protein [Dokdonia sp. Hel_I_53]TVZ52579.1 1-acyl-sn-glycerol-3-phosphate acyltransferase [Dokdonia sp. Hel_I_53]
MEILNKIFTAIWKVWFYFLMLVVILILSPLLIISILKETWYGVFFRLAQIWARTIMLLMGFVPLIKREEKFVRNKSYMLVSNHTSMLDILLMLHLAKNPFVFVGKAELAKIPLFGFFYKRTCILVDRGNARSRKAVFDQAQRRLNQGFSICIFPEGGVPDDTSLILDSFKDGAFRLAIDHQLPIVPITFYDNKKRFPYSFLEGGPGKLRARVHTFIPTAGMSQVNKMELREETRKVILTALEKHV